MTRGAWFVLCLLTTTTSSLVRDVRHAFRRPESRASRLFMVESSPSPKAKRRGTLLPQTEFPPLVTRTRRRRRKSKSKSGDGPPMRRRRPPVVDSTLLRFLGKEKKSLMRPKVEEYRNGTTNNNQTRTSSTTEAVLPKAAKDLVISMTRTSMSPSSTSSLVESSSSSSSSSPSTTALDEMDVATADTWWGQFNSHRVEAVLLAQDDSLDRQALATAGIRVQSQALARAARRRIRAFLKKRDQAWASNSSSSSISSSSDSTAYSSLSASEELTNEDMMGADVDVGFSSGGSSSSSNSNTEGTCHEFQDVVEMLLEKGLTAKDVVAILHHTPGIALMRPRAEHEDKGAALETTIDRVLHLLCKTLKLRRYDARKVIRNCPGLLTMVGSKSAEQVVALLAQLSVSHNSLARDKTALPVLLSRSPAAMFRLVAFLTSDAIRMPMTQIGPLLRRPQCLDLLNVVAPVPTSTSLDGENLISGAVVGNMDNGNADAGVPSSSYLENTDPGVAAALWGRGSHTRREQINDAYRRMSKTAWTLRYQIGTADLGKVIAAYPAVLLLDAETQILRNANYLMTELGIWQDDLPRVLQLYPALLGMPVEDMERVAQYLTSLEVPPESLGSIFRSFPALLTLDIRKDMVPVIAFLRTIGVQNTGRFISRLPPVLGYSVRRELVPKWRFLQSIHADPRFEVSKFPAYFSYPLQRVIKTRYEYIQQVKRVPTQLLPLDKVLSYGDNDFAVKVMGDADGGKAFRQFAEERRKRLQEERGNRRRPPRGGGAKTGTTTTTKLINSQTAEQRRQPQPKQQQQR